MARGFGSVLGSSANDVVTAKYQAAELSQISLAGWVLINGLGTGSVGRVISQRDNNSGTANFFLSIRTNTSTIRFAQYWSGAGPAQWTCPITPLIWQHVAVTYDGSSSANAPIMYVNGVSQSVTTVTAPSGTIVTNSSVKIGIGNDGNSIVVPANWDGLLAHIGYWNGTILTPAEVLALAQGANPAFIQPEKLALYFPLDGVSNPEPDLVNGLAFLTSGTKFNTNEPSVEPLYLGDEDLYMMADVGTSPPPPPPSTDDNFVGFFVNMGRMMR